MFLALGFVFAMKFLLLISHHKVSKVAEVHVLGLGWTVDQKTISQLYA